MDEGPPKVCNWTTSGPLPSWIWKRNPLRSTRASTEILLQEHTSTVRFSGEFPPSLTPGTRIHKYLVLEVTLVLLSFGTSDRSSQTRVSGVF